jgi:hypothetical protein
MNFSCQETNKKSPKTIILKKATLKPIKENEPVAYELKIIQAPAVGSEPEVVMTAKGVVITEDVIFDFTSLDKKVRVKIYLDELDMAYLTLNGKESYLNCEE